MWAADRFVSVELGGRERGEEEREGGEEERTPEDGVYPDQASWVSGVGVVGLCGVDAVDVVAVERDGEEGRKARRRSESVTSSTRRISASPPARETSRTSPKSKRTHNHGAAFGKTR